MLLIDHLKSTGLSTQAARLMMRSGQVFYRGLPTADGNRQVTPEDVELRPRGPRIHIGKAPVLLLRDRHIMVVFKPAGLLSVTASGRREISMLASLHRKFGTVLPVNVLPEEVAGVMVLALTRPVQEKLQAQRAGFEERFTAIVDGVLEADTDELRLVEQVGGSSVVSLSPGASLDAMRARLAAMDLPIIGDRQHAPGRISREHPHPALCGSTLGFAHPDSGAAVRFDLPLPDDLELLRRKLARR